MILAYTLAACYALWVAYLAVMNLKRAKDAGQLTGPARILGAPLLVTGLLLDWAVNMIIGTVLFIEPPRAWDELVTDRLKRHCGRDNWRGRIASAICRHLLDSFDPGGKHC